MVTTIHRCHRNLLYTQLCLRVVCSEVQDGDLAPDSKCLRVLISISKYIYFNMCKSYLLRQNCWKRIKTITYMRLNVTSMRAPVTFRRGVCWRHPARDDLPASTVARCWDRSRWEGHQDESVDRRTIYTVVFVFSLLWIGVLPDNLYTRYLLSRKWWK